MICRKKSKAPTKTPTLDKAVRYPWDSGKELFPSRTKKKASEPEGPEAIIPVISLMALLYGDAETASGGTRRHQNASSKASSRYSHSMVSVLPSRHSSCAQFSVSSRAECRQVTPCRVSSASGAKAGTTSIIFRGCGRIVGPFGPVKSGVGMMNWTPS